MSELVLERVNSFLADASPQRLHNLLKGGPKVLANELRVNWLPKGWSKERELNRDFDAEQLEPDTPAAADAATADGQRIDQAETVWKTFSPDQQRVMLKAVELVSDPGTSQDVRRLLGWGTNED